MVTAGVECVLSALAVRVGGRILQGVLNAEGNTSKAPAFIRFFQPSFNLRFNRTPNLSVPPFKRGSNLIEV